MKTEEENELLELYSQVGTTVQHDMCSCRECCEQNYGVGGTAQCMFSGIMYSMQHSSTVGRQTRTHPLLQQQSRAAPLSAARGSH